MFTPGDVDDRKPLEYKTFMEFIYGKLVDNKGYVGRNLFERLFVDGIRLITKLKSDMKGALMSFQTNCFSENGPSLKPSMMTQEYGTSGAFKAWNP